LPVFAYLDVTEPRAKSVGSFGEETSCDVETIKNLLVPAPNGARVPLAQVSFPIGTCLSSGDGCLGGGIDHDFKGTS